MNPDELEQLLQELLQGIQQVMQSGEVLSDEFQGMLAQTLNAMTDRIDELRQQPIQEPVGPTSTTEADQPTTPTPVAGEGALPTGGRIPELEQAPHESSNISRFRYEPNSKKLYVQFLGKHPNPNGPVYSYEGVPPNIFDVLRRGAVSPKTSGKNAWHTWREGTTPSHGAAMYALIKQGGYPYQRLS